MTPSLYFPAGTVGGHPQASLANPPATMGDDKIIDPQLDATPLGSEPWALTPRSNLMESDLSRLRRWDTTLSLAAIAGSHDPARLTSQVLTYLDGGYQVTSGVKCSRDFLTEAIKAEYLWKMGRYLFEGGAKPPGS